MACIACSTVIMLAGNLPMVPFGPRTGGDGSRREFKVRKDAQRRSLRLKLKGKKQRREMERLTSLLDQLVVGRRLDGVVRDDEDVEVVATIFLGRGGSNSVRLAGSFHHQGRIGRRTRTERKRSTGSLQRCECRRGRRYRYVGCEGSGWHRLRTRHCSVSS